MLDVVKPSKSMGQFDFLEINKFLKMASNIKMNDNIGSSNILPNNEHSHSQMLINMIDKLFSVHSACQFNKAFDFISFF